MKCLGTDFGIKYILFEKDGIMHTVQFRSNYFKGVYDPYIRVDDKQMPQIKIIQTYPGLLRRITEVGLLVKVHVLKKFIQNITKSHS